MDLVNSGGRAALGFMLLAFILTFGATRLIVRLIRAGRGPFGNVKVGETHVHHLVPGIFLILITGVAEFAMAPHGAWRSALAAGFGVGAALTLDELALWLHLDDVYWSEKGRVSVDAVIFAAGIAAIMLVAANPFAPEQDEDRSFFAGFLVFNLLMSIVAALKGKLFSAVAGVLVPLVALVAAVRLARPGSYWFRRFYRPGSKRYGRAERRARNSARRPWGAERVKIAVSGLPHRTDRGHQPPDPR